MAQNISLLGASYSAVPAVTLPKTGGGTASFTDVTDTTAAAADVASGKYFYTSAGVRTQGTSSGGGGGGDTIEWKASRASFPAFGGIYNGKNLTLDFDNKAATLPGINHIGMSGGADGKLILKNLSTTLTSTNMNLGDFLRQAPAFKEIDLGGAAPATMTRWFYQWGYSANNKFATTPITITNLSLDNLSSNNNSFSGSGTYAQTADVYFLGNLKNTVNLTSWSMLNADSWNRLIERLYDYSGGTAHTLTVGNTILALIDSAHQAIATARGWTLA